MLVDIGRVHHLLDFCTPQAMTRARLRHRILARVAAVAAFVGLAGCNTTGAIRQNASGPAADESIIVVGIAPAEFNLGFFPGETRNGVFSVDKWAMATVMGHPENGYLVGRAAAGKTLAITAVVHRLDSIRQYGFDACGSMKTHTWQVPAGKVLYLGDFDVIRRGQSVSVKSGFDLDKMKAYLRTHHPALEPRVEIAPSTLMATTRECAGQVRESNIEWVQTPRP